MDVDHRIFGDGMVSMEFFRPTGNLLTGLVYLVGFVGCLYFALT